mmetsp:Transcript_22706/g.46275  ORF Transcript_22706/g.46275 Transcript_22706/m.46275 type:complete len:223 (+) Transcript_22706:303-971(+)
MRRSTRPPLLKRWSRRCRRRSTSSSLPARNAAPGRAAGPRRTSSCVSHSCRCRSPKATSSGTTPSTVAAPIVSSRVTSGLRCGSPSARRHRGASSRRTQVCAWSTPAATSRRMGSRLTPTATRRTTTRISRRRSTRSPPASAASPSTRPKLWPLTLWTRPLPLVLLSPPSSPTLSPTPSPTPSPLPSPVPLPSPLVLPSPPLLPPPLALPHLPPPPPPPPRG